MNKQRTEQKKKITNIVFKLHSHIEFLFIWLHGDFIFDLFHFIVLSSLFMFLAWFSCHFVMAFILCDFCYFFFVEFLQNVVCVRGFFFSHSPVFDWVLCRQCIYFNEDYSCPSSVFRLFESWFEKMPMRSKYHTSQLLCHSYGAYCFHKIHASS